MNSVARITWNRITKTIRYRSLNEPMKIDCIFKQKGKRFIPAELQVLSNGHSSRDMQHKIQKITLLINQNYSKKLK